MVSGGSDRDGVAQARRPFGRGDADAVVTLTAEQLSALAGSFAQPREDGSCSGEQPVLARRGRQLAQPWSEDEPAVQVT